MQMYEAQAALDGLIWQNRTLLDALRLNTLVSASTWSDKPMRLTDFGHYPWDDDSHSARDVGADDGWTLEGAIEASAGALDGIILD